MHRRVGKARGVAGVVMLGMVGGLVLFPGCVTEEHDTFNFSYMGSESEKGSTSSSLEGFIKIQERRVKKMPERADLWGKLAELYFRDEQYRRAIDTIQHAIKLQPKNGKFYYYQGMFFSQEGRFEEAESSLRKAMNFSREGFTGVHLQLGYVLAQQDTKEKWEQAIAQYKIVLALEPKHPTAYYFLGSCYDLLGKRETAIQNFKNCWQIQSWRGMANPHRRQAGSEISRLTALKRLKQKNVTSGTLKRD